MARTGSIAWVAFPLVLLDGDTRQGDLRSRAAMPLDFEMFWGNTIFIGKNVKTTLPMYLSGRRNWRWNEKRKEETNNEYGCLGDPAIYRQHTEGVAYVGPSSLST